jgi:dephospho-CoA kinase
MPVVGLTGLIGAGKSTVARQFGDLGAIVVDADAIAHRVLDEPALRAAVAARFGPGVIAADGAVRRGALAERVFGPDAAHEAALTDLEDLVHPPVRARIAAAVAEAFAAPRGTRPPVVVLDVPLLAQSGFGARSDMVVIVTCAEGLRRERLAARKLSSGQQAAREAAWQRAFARAGAGAWPVERTRTVDTSVGLAYTLNQVDRLWSELVGGLPAGRPAEGVSPE